ncbi:hypothetical protein Ancab_010056 [Ancistrocladus abbreviatus]
MMWSRTVKGGLAEEREGLGAEFWRLVEEFTLMLGTPNVSDFFPVLRRFDLQGVEKRMKECSGRLDKIFDEIISQRLRLTDQREENESGCSKDFLQILLELKDTAPADGKTALTINHAKALFLVFLSFSNLHLYIYIFGTMKGELYPHSQFAIKMGPINVKFDY